MTIKGLIGDVFSPFDWNPSSWWQISW